MVAIQIHQALFLNTLLLTIKPSQFKEGLLRGQSWLKILIKLLTQGS